MRYDGTIFVGIDLGTSTRRKSTGIAYLVEKNGKPFIERSPEHIISDDVLIHSFLKYISDRAGTMMIGIDAPLSRPEHGTMRECEIRLRKQGIACYPSGAGWVGKWVDKGIALKDRLENELKAKVIEVYPYGSRRVLGLGDNVKKKSEIGRRVIQDGLLELVSGLAEITEDILLSHDELDAILAAFTAYCAWNGSAIAIDGEIYLPMKMKKLTAYRKPHRTIHPFGQ